MASRAQASNVRRLLVAVVLFLGPVSQLFSSSAAEAAAPVAQARQQVALPTPRSHYDTFKPGTSGLPLLLDLLKQLDPETQKVLLRLAMASGVHDIGADPELASAAAKQPRIPKEQAIALIKQTISSANRPLLLEFFLHESHVLQMIPEKWGSIWAPIVHDALLYFLDHLSDDRLFDKLVSLAYLPQGTSRGDYLKEFVSRIPSLQKLCQILARIRSGCRLPTVAPGFGKRHSYDDSGGTGSVHQR